MGKNTEKCWFLIESLQATVDLSRVTHVFWNHKIRGHCYVTEIVFKNSSFFDPLNDMDAWWIRDMAEREKLQAALVKMGLPTVPLLALPLLEQVEVNKLEEREPENDNEEEPH